MKNFDQNKYNNFLLTCGVIGFFDKDIILKSGRKCRYYANCRRLTDSSMKTLETASFVNSFINDNFKGFDYVYGVPAGATKLAIAINLQSDKDIPLVIGREKPKKHGEPKDRFFIGPIKSGQKIILIEDVTTTGQSLLNEVKKLHDAGIEILGAIGLVDRQEYRDDGLSVAEALLQKGIKYLSMSTSSELISKIFSDNPPDIETIKKVKDYFEKYSYIRL